MFRHFLALVVSVPAALGSPRPAGVAASDISVAAAADLQTVLPTIAQRFQAASGRAVGLTFGSSGNFFSQIQNGAPFDVFFSADVEYPRRLEAAGLAEPGSLITYATGRIVVWWRRDSGLRITALDALTDARIRRIAIANPEHAPYGRAAVAALRHERVYDRVRGKIVHGENVSQAAQFVDSGNADVGIIALSLALDASLKQRGSYFDVPAADYAPIQQAAVVLRAATNKQAAREFLALFRTPDVIRLMQSFGFAPPSPGTP